MKSKQSLMAALIGVAMIAMPVAAAAGDHGREANRGSHRVEQGRSFNAPAVFNNRIARHSAWNHNLVPAFYRGPNTYGYRYTHNQAPGAVVPVGHHYGWRNNSQFGSYPGSICDGDGDDCHPGARYENDGDEGESGGGYQGQSYAP